MAKAIATTTLLQHYTLKMCSSHTRGTEMDYEFKSPVSQDIEDACKLPTADARRTELRRLAQQSHELNDILNEHVMSEICISDLIKDNYPKFRGSPSALIGMLPEEVLILIAENVAGIEDDIIKAIVVPSKWGVKSSTTKHGYVLGLHNNYEGFVTKSDNTTTVEKEEEDMETEKLDMETLLAVYDCLRSLGGHHVNVIKEMNQRFPDKHIDTSLNALILNRKSMKKDPDYTLPVNVPSELDQFVIPCCKSLGLSTDFDDSGAEYPNDGLPHPDDITDKDIEAVATLGLSDTNLKTADQVLTGLGANVSLSEMLEERKQFADATVSASKQLEELKQELAKAQSKSAFAKPTSVAASNAASNPAKTDSTPLQVDVVWKTASDLFPDMTSCSFDVPTFNWKTPHPDVPEIDPNYVFRGEYVANVLFCLLSNKKGYISGHTGTGKTTLIEQVCAVLKYPFKRVNFDSEITRMDLVGREVLVTDGKGGTQSKFVDGILPKAVGMPCVLCLDEIDFIRPDVAYVLQRALESKGFTVLEDGDRFIQPHEMFRIMATGNTKGQGDDTGAYQGARHQSLAFLDRFSMFMTIPYLDEKREVELITSHVSGFPKPKAQELVRFANEVREAFQNGSIYTSVSIRGLTTCAETYAHYLPYMKNEEETLNYALETSIMNRCTQQDFANISEIATRVFTGEMEFTYQ